VGSVVRTVKQEKKEKKRQRVQAGPILQPAYIRTSYKI
jgi:hypothetical protein